VDRRASTERHEAGFDIDIACDETNVYVVSGDELLAINTSNGTVRWRALLRSVGGAITLPGKSVPMASQGLVVIGAGGGTAAFRVSSGELAWLFPYYGTRAIYGGRVYLTTIDSCHVVDLATGEALLQVPLASLAETRWGLHGVQFSSHLAVSETHGFIGDTRGRLYAFDRTTGEPVWMDRPKGITGFSGNIPVIAGNRLYISSFSMAPAPPPRLYCYEGNAELAAQRHS
jgi:outer membrane protein assembly factor BamB